MFLLIHLNYQAEGFRIFPLTIFPIPIHLENFRKKNPQKTTTKTGGFIIEFSYEFNFCTDLFDKTVLIAVMHE